MEGNFSENQVVFWQIGAEKSLLLVKNRTGKGFFSKDCLKNYARGSCVFQPVLPHRLASLSRPGRLKELPGHVR